MSLRYLLDTNALSEPARPIKNLAFMRRLSKAVHEIATCAPAVAEVWFGLEILPQGRRREALEAYYGGILTAMPILPFDAAAAQLHGRLRAELRRGGRAAPYADSLIAAVARSHGLTLVTANVKDFAGITDLQVEDWTAPPGQHGTV